MNFHGIYNKERGIRIDGRGCERMAIQTCNQLKQMWTASLRWHVAHNKVWISYNEVKEITIAHHKFELSNMKKKEE